MDDVKLRRAVLPGDQLRLVLERALELARLQRENRELRQQRRTLAAELTTRLRAEQQQDPAEAEHEAGHPSRRHALARHEQVRERQHGQRFDPGSQRILDNDKNADIAVGNVVGSNIFNIFFVLGISATIRPLPFQTKNNIDLGMVILSSLMLFFFMFTGKKRSLDRWEGIVCLIIYFGYISLLIVF